MIDRIEYPACPICGKDEHETLWPKDNIMMVKCLGCGQVMARPRFDRPRRMIFLQYFSWKDANNKVRFSQIHGDENLKDNVLPKLQILTNHGINGDGASLIDIGCGTGAFLCAARDAGFNVSGIEPGWFSSYHARKFFGLNVNTVSLESFKVGKLFDIVVCLHVIEHISDPLGFSCKLASICSRNGIVMLATPNLGCDHAKRLGAGWEAVGPADHIFLFDKKTLHSLLSKAGFDIIEIKETGKHKDELIALCHPL